MMAVTCILCFTALWVGVCSTPITLEYKPMRPSYAGATGGNWVNYAGQRIPLGKPWPSKPEDYANFSATTSGTIPKKQFDMLLSTSTEPTEDLSTTESFVENETLTTLSYGMNDTNMERTNISERYPATSSPGQQTPTLPNRPPFLGPTGGNFLPQLVPPGKPWPARPETSDNVTTLSPDLEDDINETTTTKEIEVVIPPQLPVPNRPPFLGPTGGNFIPQSVPPGQPWPDKLEDYEGFSATSQKPKDKDERIVFPDDPFFYRKIIKVESTPLASDDSNLFSVAFYLGDVNSTKADKPSLAVSIDLNAVNRKASKPDAMKATEQFLSSEKVGNTNQSNNYSVWINLKDIASSKKSSARINVTKPNEEISTVDTLISGEANKNSSKIPFLSIFVNFEDFKNMRNASSTSEATKAKFLKNNLNNDNDARFAIPQENKISISGKGVHKD